MRALIRITGALCFLCATTVANAEFSAGFVQLPPSAQPTLGIWYPSTSAETAGKLGPFKPVLAWDGEAARGEFPVIVLSHGRTGRHRNHWLTAAELARAGYVVAAPTHAADHVEQSRDKIIAMVNTRVSELKRAVVTVDAHPVVGKIADTSQLGALGYSLGTLTALYAAGATPEMSRVAEHCTKHGDDDIDFCGGGWLSKFFAVVRSALAWLKEKEILKPQDKTQVAKVEFEPTKPLDFAAIALVTPVGVPFSPEVIRQQTAALALFRFGDDSALRYPHHAEYLHRALGNIPHHYKTYPDVHHYAFIAPFPQWLIDEGIPVAQDPKDFDRAGFIREINRDIVNFFRENL